jgi:hypothetical protein
MAHHREEYIVTPEALENENADSDVDDDDVHNTLAKSHIRELYQITVVQPAIHDILHIFSKLTLEDVQAWGWIES